jgi:two-component system cell cycle response regulator DivK
MGPRILVAEDMEDNLELFQDVLEIAGYTVLTCTDGLAAVQMAVTDQPALILMDISLPGIDGHEATRRIRGQASTRHIPVIAVTAHAMPSDRELALEAGCSAYLAKPVSPRVLAQVVADLISGPQPRS